MYASLGSRACLRPQKVCQYKGMLCTGNKDMCSTCRQLNAVDEALWQHGKLLHAKQLQGHKQEGRLASVMAGMQQPSICMWRRGLLHSPSEFLVWQLQLKIAATVHDISMCGCR